MKKNGLSRTRVFTGFSKSLRDALRRALALIAVLALVLTPAAPGLYAAPSPAKAPAPMPDEGDHDGCKLSGPIKHVVLIQFDNVHFRRDNPNVPSDVEQMPNLYNFLTDNGTVLNNHYTPLIWPHTADDIITSIYWSIR